MLFVYNRCLSRVPLQRIIFTGAIASIFTVFILYIALTKNDEANMKKKNSIVIEKMDYNVMVFNNNTNLEKREETQIENFWKNDDDDYYYLDEYESFLESNEEFPELSDEDMERLNQRMAERRQRVKDVCKEFKIDSDGKVNAYEFLINDQHHLIWCNIFKAASTSWMYNFNLMAGFSKKEASESDQPQAMARERYPRPSVDELMDASTNSTSMIIVRHPFERLSSAYRDKMQNSPPMSMYADLAEKIVMNYRVKRESESEESWLYPIWPTFEEFIRYVLDEAASGNEMDIHWAPYTPFCTPCHYDFDIIAKFETLEEDQKYLIQKAGLRNVITPQWRNSGGAKSAENGISSRDLMLTHYSQLTSFQIADLYEIYRYDFLIFNYTAGDYFSMVSDLIDDPSFEIYDYSDEENTIEQTKIWE